MHRTGNDVTAVPTMTAICFDPVYKEMDLQPGGCAWAMPGK